MKIKVIFRKNIKVILAFGLGLIISGSGVYAATTAASDVSYSPPSGSGLSSNVQSAISELYNLSSNYFSSAGGSGVYYARLGSYNYFASGATSLENYLESANDGNCSAIYGSCRGQGYSHSHCCTNAFDPCYNSVISYCDSAPNTTAKSVCINYTKQVMNYSTCH